MELSHHLTLALRLLDAAAGTTIPARSVRLLGGGSPLPLLDKGVCLALIDQARADFCLSVSARGYEPLAAQVDYAALDPRLPWLDVFLVPAGEGESPYPCLTLSGTRPGLLSLCAVRAGEGLCLLKAADPAKKLLTLFTPHNLGMERVRYALLDPGGAGFQPFSLLERLSDGRFRADRVPVPAPGLARPVCPVVSGLVRSGGRYLLRVRDDGRPEPWLVRWESVDGVRFSSVDLRAPLSHSPAEQEKGG